MNEHNPAIVVAAYNRPESLSRLLTSLSNAYYEHKTRLIISIDKSTDNRVIKLAEQFEWHHGKKTTITHDVNLGLREHIIRCGDLTSQYGSIILLEDDLFVSPYFYKYAASALNYYNNDNNIAGISLYDHKVNYIANMPFISLKDDSDVYFLQLASSWGQAWTKAHWDSFKDWYNKNQSINHFDMVPSQVKKWPESSWLKYFIAYMVTTSKYFVYPNTSLSTNFCAPGGQHIKNASNLQQTPLLSQDIDFKFKNLSESVAVYDAFFEILPEKLNLLAQPSLPANFDIDLYGKKDLACLTSNYILTTRQCRNNTKSFGLNLKPIELNVIMNNPGNDIYLARKDDLLSGRKHKRNNEYKKFLYFYAYEHYKKMIYFAIRLIINKIKS